MRAPLSSSPTELLRSKSEGKEENAVLFAFASLGQSMRVTLAFFEIFL